MTMAFALPADVEVLARSADGVSSAFLVDPRDEVFAGHYPGFPVLPGVMLVEAVVRTVRAWGHDPRCELVALDRARFLRPVRPGERVFTDVAAVAGTGGLSVKATARTDAGRVAEFRMTFGDPLVECGRFRTAARACCSTGWTRFGRVSRWWRAK
jgi:3-hydroxyacyl-[acyl-carrier-protein] dehydratase